MDPFTLFITVLLPYISIFVFIIGISYRILRWFIVPVPFQMPTTPAPTRIAGVAARVSLDVFIFRSLLKGAKKLWGGGLLFHVSLWSILLYKLLLYVIPLFTAFTKNVIDLSPYLQTPLISTIISYFGIFFLASLIFLLFRRLILPNISYVTRISDYLILLLLIGIGFTGVYMRAYEQINAEEVMAYIIGIGSFNPILPPANLIFILHFTLVQMLFIYLPFSKIMHMIGIILSPTRNQRNIARAKRHVNPWNDKVIVEIRSWEDYYNEYKKELEELGPDGERR